MYVRMWLAVGAHAFATAGAAEAPLAVMLADAGAPAVLEVAPDAVMLADAGSPAVLAFAPAAVVLALLAPPLRCLCLPLAPPPSASPCSTASSACCPVLLP